ncbi:protein Mpv17-like [Dysidea avara]|uniref:protein Mpv17-like n=1 Tax=Dysidea avara TaxID=196820 RepID=UPI003321CAC0
MSVLLAWYGRQLSTRPNITNATTTGVLFALGDVIAQKLIEKQKKLDWGRSARFGLVGFCFAGPVIGGWYRLLDRVITSTGPTTALKKVLCDQCLFAPCIYVALLPLIGVSKGLFTTQELKQQLTKDYKHVLINNWKIWPAVQLANFYFVPLHFRLVVVNIVALGWNTYLSWVAHQ